MRKEREDMREKTALDISKWTRDWAEAKGLPYTYYPLTDSSSSRAKDYFPTMSEDFHLFIAKKQTRGRGQNKNIWLDSCLMTSWLWKKTLPFPGKNLFHTKDFVGDLLQSITTLWPSLEVEFKSPNDILLKGKKVAGLLLEMIEQPPLQATILGLGMNVVSHPANVNAGHLRDHLSTLSSEEWIDFLNVLYSAWAKRIQRVSFTDGF